MKVLILLLSLIFIGANAYGKYTYSNESEVGQTTTGGNAETVLFNAGQMSKWVNDHHQLQFDGSYLYGEAQDNLNVRNWSAKLTFTRDLSEHFGIFASQQAEGNPFQGFYERFNTDLGATIYIIKPTKENIKELKFELGLRYSKENRIVFDPNFKSKNYQSRGAMFYTQPISKTFLIKDELEMIGNINSPGRFRANNVFSLENTLTEMLSLKISYTLKYDDYLPSQGLKELDYIYTTSLLAKF